METGTFNSSDTGGMSDGITEYSGSESSYDTVGDELNNGASSSRETLFNDGDNQGVNNYGNENQDFNQGARAPENYEPFNLPQGIDANNPEVQGMFNEAQGLFKKSNLTQAQAQELVDFHFKALEATKKQWMGGAVNAEELFMQQAQKECNKWGEETKRDPEFGGANLNQSKVWINKAIAELGRRLPRFGGQSGVLKAFTETTGAINHPVIWATLALIGRDFLSEDKFVRGNNGARPVDNSPEGMARRLYPDMYR